MAATVTKLVEKRETEKAYQFAQLDRDGREGAPFWIPKSQILYRRKIGTDIEIHLPEWLADEKGVNYY